MEFIKPKVVSRGNDGAAWDYLPFHIQAATVESIAAMHDGYVTIEHVSNPNSLPLFMIEIISVLGVRSRIIYDGGDEWHRVVGQYFPSIKKTKYKVTDYKNYALSEFDKDLLKQCIGNYASNLTSYSK